MSEPVLIAITDTERAAAPLWLARLEPLLAGARPGSVLVMLRDRQLEARARQAFGVQLRELTARHGQLFAVNDRLDLALLCDADAVHLSESSVSAADARAFGRGFSRSWWLSRACHDPEQVALGGVDGVLLSPIAAARKGREALGAAGLARARAALGRQRTGGLRLYALGGVDPENAARWLAAGADGVALIGALLEPGAPRALLAGLRLARAG